MGYPKENIYAMMHKLTVTHQSHAGNCNTCQGPTQATDLCQGLVSTLLWSVCIWGGWGNHVQVSNRWVKFHV
jgi:hypothetical protein